MTTAVDMTEEFLRSLLFEEDWDNNPHLQGTPKRFARMLVQLTTPDEFSFTTFPNEGCDEMVVVSDIPFYTFCAHHVLPFTGKAHIAYVPNKVIAGISKLPRTVQHFAKGLNVQEELTQMIANFLDANLSPVGVGVVMEAEHLCMTMRGAQVPGTMTRTSALKGCFRNPDERAREEFLSLVRAK